MMGPFPGDLPLDDLTRWSSTHGIRIAFVAASAYIANMLLRHAIQPAVMAAVLHESIARNDIDRRKRADTLATVMVRTAQLGVLVVASFVVLDELGYNVAPFLTGLGIGGVALGLGAQSLVRDTINGIFILVENQYGRGDLVTIGGVQGWVEAVNLRRTVVRDVDGTLFTIPNSEVRVAGNLTRGYSGISLLVPLWVLSDIDRAMELIDKVGHELADDPDLGPTIVEAPYAARLEGLTDKTATVRVLGKVTPGAQFEVAGALRRRIKRDFDAAEIRFGEPVPAPAAPSAAARPPARPT